MPMQTDRLICKYYNASEEGGLVFATRLEKRDLMIMQTGQTRLGCANAQPNPSLLCLHDHEADSGTLVSLLGCTE